MNNHDHDHDHDQRQSEADPAQWRERPEFTLSELLERLTYLENNAPIYVWKTARAARLTIEALLLRGEKP